MGYAYEFLTALLVHSLADADRFMEDRVAYVEKARIGSARLSRGETRLKTEISVISIAALIDLLSISRPAVGWGR
jgi:hypothetical protein